MLCCVVLCVSFVVFRCVLLCCVDVRLSDCLYVVVCVCVFCMSVKVYGLIACRLVCVLGCLCVCV